MYSTSLKQRTEAKARRKEMTAENIASGFKSRFLKKKKNVNRLLIGPGFFKG